MNISFDINDAVLLHGSYATVTKTRPGWTVLKLESGEFREISDDEAMQLLLQGSLQATARRQPQQSAPQAKGYVKHYLSLSPAEAARVDKRVAILNQLEAEEGAGPYNDKQLANYALRTVQAWPEKLRLSRTTLRDWLALAAAGKIEGLFPQRDKRFENEVEDIIQDAIDKHYHARAPQTGATIHELICIEIRTRNTEAVRSDPKAVQLTEPSRATIHRRIEEQDDKKRIAAQMGSHRANMIYGTFGAAEIEPVPMRVVEIDHTMIDLEVVDKSGINLGRPWLTTAIDRATRMIVGFNIGWTPPSTTSVLLTLRHMLEDKSYLRGMFGSFLDGQFVECGLPGTIVCDNGKEFHSAALRRTCGRFHITQKFAARQQAHLKGRVERFFRTLNDQVFHALPGTTLSTFDRKSDYRPKHAAQITLDELNVVLHKYLIDIYPNQWHRGLKNTPLMAWQKPKVRFAPRFPYEPEETYLLTCPVVERPVHPYGIELFGLKYKNEEFSKIRVKAKGSALVEVRYDPLDMSEVHVFDVENRRFISAEIVDKSMKGLSIWHVKALTLKYNQRRAELLEENFARRAAWFDVLGLTNSLRPSAKYRSKKALARSLTLPVTPGEQLRYTSLDLHDRSTFHGGLSRGQSPSSAPEPNDFEDLTEDALYDAVEANESRESIDDLDARLDQLEDENE